MSRHYQHWTGRNRVLCGGRVLLAPSLCGLLTTATLHAGTIVEFCLQVTPHYDWYFTLVFCVLFSLSFYFLLRCALSDPGILPRCLNPGPLVTPEPPRDQRDVDGGDLRYCDTCHLFRPPRAKHCRWCDNCVLQFESGTQQQPVGLRNYRYFFGFITSLTALSCYSSVLCFLRLESEAESYRRAEQSKAWEWEHALSAYPAVFVLAVFSASVCLAVGFLLCYHLSLLRRGETTNESIRGVFLRRINPFDRGLVRNTRQALCAPLPPSQIDFLAERVGVEGVPGMARHVTDMMRRRNYTHALVLTPAAATHGGDGQHAVAQSDSSLLHASHSNPQSHLLDLTPPQSQPQPPLRAERVALDGLSLQLDGSIPHAHAPAAPSAVANPSSFLLPHSYANASYQADIEDDPSARMLTPEGQPANH